MSRSGTFQCIQIIAETAPGSDVPAWRSDASLKRQTIPIDETQAAVALARVKEPSLEQLRPLFERALATPAAARGAFVRASCGGDVTLEDELTSLIDAHEASNGYFEKLIEELIGPALSSIELADRDEAVDDDRHVLHYEIIDRIGSGGMGVVYRARDTRLGRTVALKFLPRRHASNPAARARLLAEARAASALDHPNIGVVYEISEAEDGRQFIAMAWHDGETLRERARRSPLAISEAVEVAAQIGRALAAAHAAGVIHRDVKPANVIMTRAGAVKLVDFGIAKLMSDDDGEKHTAAGTVAYMSPEQTLDIPLDKRTDIWSLGVLLYEILTGRRPFRGESDDLVMSAIRNADPDPVASLRPDVPPPLAAVVHRCLSKDRDQRYLSAEELCAALEDWNTGAAPAIPISNEKPSRWRAWISTPHRRTALVGFPSLAAFAVAAILWLTSSEPGDRGAVGTPGARPIALAVLPFLDSTGAEGKRYLVEGLSDDVRAELSRIGGVTVPGYLSSASYAAISRRTSEVPPGMGATYLVTGAVRRNADRTQVSIRLVDGATGKPRWSRIYDATATELPAIPRNARREILSELEVVDPRDNERPAQAMDAAAYDLYLRGRYVELSGLPRKVLGRRSVENIRSAHALYSQARLLDPTFDLLRAKLALTHMQSAAAYDTSRARIDQARVEAEAALRMDPRLPDAHEAIAAYWVAQDNDEKAIQQLETALRATPNNARLHTALGTRYSSAGRWEEAIAQHERAMELDPLNPHTAWLAAMTYGRMRRQDKGMGVFDRIIRISPDDHMVKVIKGQSYLRWKGSTTVLSDALRSIPPDWDDDGMATYGRYTALRVERRYRDALVMLDSARTELSRDGLVYHPKSLMRAEMYHALGETRAARRHYEEARREMSATSAANPRDPSIHAALGLAYAGLGMKREAIREADLAIDLSRASSRAATAMMGIAIEILGRTGELDRAFEMIELMLSMQSGREITLPFLRVWPGFDPLRKDPRFDELLRRFTEPG